MPMLSKLKVTIFKHCSRKFKTGILSLSFFMKRTAHTLFTTHMLLTTEGEDRWKHHEPAMVQFHYKYGGLEMIAAHIHLKMSIGVGIEDTDHVSNEAAGGYKVSCSTVVTVVVMRVRV